MICSLSVIGWEEYDPSYFECPSKEDFEKEVSEAIRSVIYLLEEDDGYIGGDDVKKLIMPMLCKKFKHIKIEHEIDIGGACYYTKETEYNPKPSIIDDEIWSRILKHNEEIHNETYKDLKKED